MNRSSQNQKKEDREFTSIYISKNIKNRLDELKVHRRQAYYEVIDDLIDKNRSE